MELSAIYHRPESEYAYLYKDKKLHIRIRTKKGDIESINLHYGDPFIFMEEFYQDTKKMAKITSDAIFDYWQVEVSVDFARIQYLFEVTDTEGQSILYGDKGCVENSLENLHAIGNGFKLPYHAFGFEDYMPKLNTANPEVKDYLLKVATYWIEEFNIDAWRLDVANEIDHQFWKDFRKAVLAKKPDLYILGEVWHTSQPWLNGDEFHAVMNYPLSDSTKEYFLRGVKKTDQFIDEINGQSMYYKQQISEVMFNLLDSHDTERILWMANEDVQLVKSALAFLFFQKGTPCIYYGTELSLTGGPDPDCRRCMPWERVSSDNDMLNFMKKLIQIRKHASAIIQHDKYSLQEIKPDLVALEWSYDNQVIKAIFNQSKEDYHLQKEAVALASNCQELENQLVISPKGFVIFH